MRTSLHEIAQRVDAGDMAIKPGQTVGGWSFYNDEHALWTDEFRSADGWPQNAKTNHVLNVNPNGGTINRYNRIKSSFTVAGPFSYAGWAMPLRSSDPKGSNGFKVAFCHQQNYTNYLMSVNQSGAFNIWKEDRVREGGFGRVLVGTKREWIWNKAFHWRIEVDGRGGIMARVDDVEITCKDELPLYSGTLGFRLDNLAVAFGGDGLSI